MIDTADHYVYILTISIASWATRLTSADGEVLQSQNIYLMKCKIKITFV